MRCSLMGGVSGGYRDDGITRTPLTDSGEVVMVMVAVVEVMPILTGWKRSRVVG